MKTVSFRFAKLINIGLFGFTLLSVGLGVAPAYALPPIGSPSEELSKCLGDLQGSISIPRTVDLWQNATLSWNVKDPSCGPGLQIYIDNQVVPLTGSRSIQPIANTGYTLHAQFLRGRRTLATTGVTVLLPPIVTINTNHLARLLVQALRTENTTVIVANHVQLDLSNRNDILLAAGVVLRGGRGGLNPGPRLYTTTRPGVLFRVGGDDVRITGVRIEGPDMGAGDRHGNRGIMVDSNINIEIDHNEIYGFSLAGIHVWDGGESMPPSEAPTAVRIHDNYIHHNQAQGGDGYGVAVGYGAHPLIDRNVFDWNRHAIEGDGKAGTGYSAYSNLVLENGGLHRWIPFPGFWVRTHQFDMHALYDCGFWDIFSDSLANCGPAGHTMYIRHNTFFYAKDNAIKLRGTPEVGMFVGANVFANHLTFDRAVHENESGLVEEPGNVLGYNGSLKLGSCDFDGDGINDSFMATGATWWYSSGGNRPWVYLNTSTKRLSQVTLGFFDGDNRCDVSVDGAIYPGGKRPVVNHIPTSGGVGGAFLGN